MNVVAILRKSSKFYVMQVIFFQIEYPPPKALIMDSFSLFNIITVRKMHNTRPSSWTGKQ